MKKTIIALAALLTLAACEKEIELKQEEVAPRIVVNSLFTADDTIKIHLSESRNILFEETLPNITNATAKLLDADDNELGTFTHTGEGYYYLASPTPVAGNVYGLSVDVPNMTSVKATSETPSIIDIASIDTVRVGDEYEFSITINDDASQENYYGVSIVYNILDEETGEVSYQSPYFSTRELFVVNGEPDVDGNNYGMEFYFPDDQFNGGSITFKGKKWIEPWGGDAGYYVIGLKSMSKDLYKYKLSYSKYQSSQGPFAEPVQVYSNIENGFGIFGGSSTYRDTIYVE